MFELLNDPMIRAELTRATLWSCAVMTGACALWITGHAVAAVIGRRP